MCFMPKIPAPPRQVQPEEANQAALRQRQMLAGAKGFSSMILTSPLAARTPSQPGHPLG